MWRWPNTDMSADRLAPFFAAVPAERQSGYAHLMTYLGNWMVFRDPPEHTRLRRLFTKAFTSRSMKALEPNVEQIVGAVVRRDGAEGAFHRRCRLDRRLRLSLAGNGDDGSARRATGGSCVLVKDLSDDIALFIGTSRATADKYLRAEAGAKGMADYFRDIHCETHGRSAGRHHQPARNGPDKREALTDDEVIATCILLLFAGHETTTNLLGNGFYYTMKLPDQWARVKDDPSLVDWQLRNGCGMTAQAARWCVS